MMRLPLEKFKEEEGTALVVALLILVVLTIIGVAATTTTEIEVQIAGNEKFHKTAFYLADSGVYVTPKVISACIDNDTELDLSPGIEYLGDANTFYREIMGFNVHDGDKDVRFALDGFNVEVDVNRTGIQNLVGGGTEFASGAEGPGVGSVGGVAVIYEMDSSGHGPGSSLSDVSAVYRKVIGVVGGL